MRAISYTRFGPAAEVLELTDLPARNPGPGEVTVALERSGVNPSDVKARAGSRPGVTKPPFDRIVPHSDGAGVITALGQGVGTARRGQRVWIWNGQWQRPFGTAANHIALPADQAVPMPDGVSMETGAVLGIPGLTAAQAVFGSGDVTGQTVLVQGGGGTVGYLAVQLAEWGGAEVIATASPRDAERVQAAGARAVIPYTEADLPAAVRGATGHTHVDRIIDTEFGVNAAADAELIAPNGTIAAYGSAKDMAPTLPFGPLLFKAARIDILLIYLLPEAERTAAIERLHDALATGALSIPIAHTYPLAEAAAAHEAVEAGGRAGAILLDCRS
ncbi:MAG: NADPH:quinone reductase [Pseudomonadota bacterium]